MAGVDKNSFTRFVQRTWARLNVLERAIKRTIGPPRGRKGVGFEFIKLNKRLMPGCHSTGRLVFLDSDKVWQEIGDGDITISDPHYQTFGLEGHVIAAHRRFFGFKCFQERGLANIKGLAAENIIPGHIGIFHVIDGDQPEIDEDGPVPICARVLPEDVATTAQSKRLLSYDRQKKEWFVVPFSDLIKFKLLEDLPRCGQARAVMIDENSDDECAEGPEIIVIDTTSAASGTVNDEPVDYAPANSMGFAKKWKGEQNGFVEGYQDSRCECPPEESSSSSGSSSSSDDAASSSAVESSAGSSSSSSQEGGDVYEVVTVFPGCCPEGSSSSSSSSSSVCEVTCEGGDGCEWFWNPVSHEWILGDSDCIAVPCESSSSGEESSEGPCECLPPTFCGGQDYICTRTSCYNADIYEPPNVGTCPGASTTTLPPECDPDSSDDGSSGMSSDGDERCTGECTWLVTPFSRHLIESTCCCNFGNPHEAGAYLCGCITPEFNTIAEGCTCEITGCQLTFYIFPDPPGGGGCDSDCCGDCVWYGIPGDLCDSGLPYKWIKLSGCPCARATYKCGCTPPSYPPGVCGFDTTPCLTDDPCAGPCPEGSSGDDGCDQSCRYEAIEAPPLTGNVVWSLAHNPCPYHCPCGKPASDPTDTCETVQIPCGTGDPPTTGPPTTSVPTTTTLPPGPPVGACCCYPDCTENVTQGVCVLNDCDWLGEDSTCAECINEPPAGGCCLPDGTCFITEEGSCSQHGGTWVDNGFNGCDGNPCGLGACCTGPPAHCEDTPESACEGTWYETLCEDTRCFPPEPRGACCVDTVCRFITEQQCEDLAGLWLGEGGNCSPNPCDEFPVGACCREGTCTVEEQSTCEDTAGIWLGEGTDCDPNPCDSPCVGNTCPGGTNEECPPGCDCVFVSGGVGFQCTDAS